MNITKQPQSKPIIPILFVLIILIPYLFAFASGTADSDLTGLASLHSRAESIYCADGLTRVTIILLIEIALLLIAQLTIPLWEKRLPALASAFKENGWYLLGVAILIAVPFLIGWETESSVCSRGKAFFWQSIYIDVFILAILAASYNLMFGFSGILSFGHAAFFGMGAYTVGLLMHHWSWPWWLAIIGALVVGVIIALIKGFVGLRIKGLYFALFTLALAEVFFLLAGNRIMVEITGAEDGFTFDVPDWLNVTRNRLLFYYIALMALVLTFIVIRRLMNSPTGRVLLAMRENDERARMIGYNTFRFQLISIIIGGVLASGAGVLRGLALKGASPNVLGLDFTMTPLIMTIIGGVSTFAGPIIGAFALRLIEQFLRDNIIMIGATELNIGEYWALILGILFVLSVMVFPQGIVGTWRQKILNMKFRKEKT